MLQTLQQVFFASQSGMPTLDQGEGGGNPFASALIELLCRESRTSYTDFYSDLVRLTVEKSRGFQTPKALTIFDSTQWIWSPNPSPTRKVALVFVYSDYRCADMASLPGAERDMERVTAALMNAGFDVSAVVDPTSDELRTALSTLLMQSEDAEAAVIYLTGHGFEHNAQVYLIPNNYPRNADSSRLSDLAIHVPSLVGELKAMRANFVFFGGCRTYT